MQFTWAHYAAFLPGPDRADQSEAWSFRDILAARAVLQVPHFKPVNVVLSLAR